MLRAIRGLVLLAPLLALVTLLLSPRTGTTLPLFARKYSLQCTQCHYAFPRLNKFGMDFKQRGYRLEGAAGESPWDLQNFPLSAVGNVGYTLTKTTHPDSTFSAFVQNTSEFHSAGTLAGKVTFHFDNNFAGVNGPLTSGQAFLMFDDVVKGGALNVKVGVYDADTPYLADSRRTTWTHYLSPVTLAGEGIELNGAQPGLKYAAGLINSARTVNKPGSHTFNNLENGYAWVTRDVSGQLVTARVYLDRQDPRSASGSASLHTQVELNAFFNSERWVVIPGITYENFSDADSTQSDKLVTGLLETMVLLGADSKWVLTGRYELQHRPEFKINGALAFPEKDLPQVVGDLAYYVNPNARVAFEYTRTSDNAGGTKSDVIQLFVHVGY